MYLHLKKLKEHDSIFYHEAYIYSEISKSKYWIESHNEVLGIFKLPLDKEFDNLKVLKTYDYRHAKYSYILLAEINLDNIIYTIKIDTGEYKIFDLILKYGINAFGQLPTEFKYVYYKNEFIAKNSESTEYREIEAKINSEKVKTELKSAPLTKKITKANVVPFTIYIDSEGKEKAILGVVSLLEKKNKRFYVCLDNVQGFLNEQEIINKLLNGEYYLEEKITLTTELTSFKAENEEFSLQSLIKSYNEQLQTLNLNNSLLAKRFTTNNYYYYYASKRLTLASLLAQFLNGTEAQTVIKGLNSGAKPVNILTYFLNIKHIEIVELIQNVDSYSTPIRLNFKNNLQDLNFKHFCFAIIELFNDFNIENCMFLKPSEADFDNIKLDVSNVINFLYHYFEYIIENSEYGIAFEENYIAVSNYEPVGIQTYTTKLEKRATIYPVDSVIIQNLTVYGLSYEELLNKI